MVFEQHLKSHISKQFNMELEEVRNLVFKMGGLVEKQVQDALKALVDHDAALAKKVIKRDKKVNALEIKIDDMCADILARRQPAASDLRLIITIIKINTDLERIGDEALKLAFSTKSIKEKHISEGREEYHAVETLGNLVLGMLKQTLDALARMDTEEAVNIMRQDDVINDEFENLLAILIDKMKSKPKTVKSIISFSWSARALERIGDHTKNINEYIIYQVKGRNVRHLDLDEIEDSLDDD
jgi:phosphate transport system protein